MDSLVLPHVKHYASHLETSGSSCLSSGEPVPDVKPKLITGVLIPRTACRSRFRVCCGVSNNFDLGLDFRFCLIGSTGSCCFYSKTLSCTPSVRIIRITKYRYTLERTTITISGQVIHHCP